MDIFYYITNHHIPYAHVNIYLYECIYYFFIDLTGNGNERFKNKKLNALINLI